MHKQFQRAALAMVLTAAVGCAATVSWTFSSSLTPDQEIPPPALAANSNPLGTASATLTYDDANLGAGGTLATSMSWSGLTSPAFMAHIHAIADPSVCRSDNGRCGVGPVLVPIFMRDPALNVGDPGGPFDTSGSFSADIAVNETQLNALINGLQLAAPATGALYFNLHTLNNRPGEIRGDIVSAEQVPEPGSVAMIGAGLIGLGVALRRRQPSRN